LVSTYGTLDDIYEHIDEITGSIQQKLIDGKEEAYGSKQLIQLMDVPSLQDVEISKYKCDFDFEHIQKTLVDGHGFTSLQKVIDELKKSYQAGDQLSLFG